MTDRITYLVFHDNRDGTMTKLREVKWDRGIDAFAHLVNVVKRSDKYAFPMTRRVARNIMPNAGWDKESIFDRLWDLWMEEKS